MCGIVGAIAERDVVPILMEGLRRLEYRGYDSAGIAVDGGDSEMLVRRAVGKVSELEACLTRAPEAGSLGIAHTRWATHGEPREKNAHPQCSGGEVAVVHNGIIENYRGLRASLEADGFEFLSDTDTEVIAHLIHRHLQAGGELFQAVRHSIGELSGAYAIAVTSPRFPDHLVVARRGSPLLIGVGLGENFAASDMAALLPVTQRVIHLEEGDIADITRGAVQVVDQTGQPVERPVQESALPKEAAEKGDYRHFMLKEIFEQPRVLTETWEGRVTDERVLDEAFGVAAGEWLDEVRAVQIVACGTSHHAGLVARYWIESLARLPCRVELASEYRYHRSVVQPGTLFVTLSQSGETADTLAALRYAREQGYMATLAICNVPERSLVRESDLTFMTRAVP